jgi:hypothetical protein
MFYENFQLIQYLKLNRLCSPISKESKFVSKSKKKRITKIVGLEPGRKN